MLPPPPRRAGPPLAEERLRACEEKFKESYGSGLERVAALKGSTGNESALLVRLNLLQGIVAFHLGRDWEARLLLDKCSVQLQMLAVSESDLLEIASMGYSVAEARLGLRAAAGYLKSPLVLPNPSRAAGAEYWYPLDLLWTDS